MAQVGIVDAARALGISERALRRDIAAGAPVLRRGSRGRGRAALLDVDAIAAWRRSRAPRSDDRLLVLAAEVPEIIGGAMHEAFALVDGPHKRLVAGALAGAGYMAIVALLDRLRREAPSVPEASTLPPKIIRLRQIFGTSGSLEPLSLPPE